jgi:WXG100 family type VII secretion target
MSADYEDIQRVSRKLDDTADDLRTILMNIFSAMSALQSGGWLGEAADQFYDEMESFMIPWIKQLGGDYEDTADSVAALIPLFFEADSHVSVYFDPGARIA